MAKDRPLTHQEKVFTQEYINTIVEGKPNATEAAVRAYNVKNRESAKVLASQKKKRLTGLNDYVEIMNKFGLDDESLAKKHNQLLHQKKPIITRDDNNKLKVIQVDDTQIQRDALGMAYKLKGTFPSEKLDISSQTDTTIKVIVEENRELLEGEIVEDEPEQLPNK